MKLNPFIHIRSGKILFGTALVDDEPRADMFLPSWLFVMGLLFSIFGAIIGIVFAVLQISVLIIVLAVAMALLGMAALLCWKNQTIRVLPNDTFEYSTFWGNKTVYRFSDIKGLKDKLLDVIKAAMEKPIFSRGIRAVIKSIGEKLISSENM